MLLLRYFLFLCVSLLICGAGVYVPYTPRLLCLVTYFFVCLCLLCAYIFFYCVCVSVCGADIYVPYIVFSCCAGFSERSRIRRKAGYSSFSWRTTNAQFVVRYLLLSFVLVLTFAELLLEKNTKTGEASLKQPPKKQGNKKKPNPKKQKRETLGLVGQVVFNTLQG